MNKLFQLKLTKEGYGNELLIARKASVIITIVCT